MEKNFQSHDYPDGMNEIVLEDWFENTLIPNLLKERIVVIVIDNVKYQSSFIKKTPTMNMKKDEMITFMSKHDIEIPNPISAKPV